MLLSEGGLFVVAIADLYIIEESTVVLGRDVHSSLALVVHFTLLRMYVHCSNCVFFFFFCQP